MYSLLFLCRESYDAAKDLNLSGHVPMLVWHDEDDSFECSGSIPGISVINSLSKTFPNTGPYAGGMVLRLYDGIGFGIPFTKKQVQQLLGNNTFTNVTRMYETPAEATSTSQLPPKQRREAKVIKLQKTLSKQEKRKSDVLRERSHNVAYIKRVQGSHALMNSKRMHKKVKTKLTFKEVALKVCEHAKSPSMACTPCEGHDVHTHDDNLVFISEENQQFYKLNSEGVVESWSGPLVVYDMTGWRKVKGGFRRPRPQCLSRGMAIRESSVKFEWLPGMVS